MNGNAAAKGVAETHSGISTFLTNIIDIIPLAIAGIIVFVIALLMARYVRSLITKAIFKTGAEDADQLAKLFGGLSHGVIVLMGLSVALNIVKVDISFIVGSLTFALGFALKDVLSNYFAGAMILLQKPFKVNDIIKIGEDVGVVKSVTARVTTLRTFDGELLVIPNNDVFTSRVRDFSAFSERRISVNIPVSYDTDLENALRLLLNVADANKTVLSFPKPSAQVDQFNDSSISILLRVWVQSVENIWDVQSALIQEVKVAFEAHKIAIPLPIRVIQEAGKKEANVHVDRDETLASAKNTKAAAASTAEAMNDLFTEQ